MSVSNLQVTMLFATEERTPEMVFLTLTAWMLLVHHRLSVPSAVMTTLRKTRFPKSQVVPG